MRRRSGSSTAEVEVERRWWLANRLCGDWTGDGREDCEQAVVVDGKATYPKPLTPEEAKAEFMARHPDLTPEIEKEVEDLWYSGGKTLDEAYGMVMARRGRR
jgi:ketosteroid isomerase-like protein